MARIRTIKPEFFTSADVSSMSPLARLLFIGLWCEADREGRLRWSPTAFRLRYLPTDECDVSQVCQEIVTRGVVTLYGEGFAVIPSFARHQHINPREPQSVLPEPHFLTRHSRDSDASVTRREEGRKEGRKEGKEDTPRVRAAETTGDDADDYLSDPGGMPTRRRKAHCAWESSRGMDVPQALHDELLGRMATRDEPALLGWYADTEQAWQGRAISDDCWRFWRARFSEWQAGAAKTSALDGWADGLAAEVAR
jgi:hypothetical protein